MRDRLTDLWWNRLLPTIAVAAIVAVGVIVIGLGVGYRPVVIQTGSMGDTAPPRSLIIAAPVAAEIITTGDIVVMRRPGATPVTHRVIEIEGHGASRFAITQGDANEAPDAAPYPLAGEQLVSRWIVPNLGGYMQSVFQPGIALIILAAAIIAIVFQTIRRIWASPEADPEPGTDLVADEQPGAEAEVNLPFPVDDVTEGVWCCSPRR